jgi:hypothetical protein
VSTQEPYDSESVSTMTLLYRLDHIDLFKGSLSADQPLSIDFNQEALVEDELEPCIEDIRLEIDRLRQEEQLLRGR